MDLCGQFYKEMSSSIYFIETLAYKIIIIITIYYIGIILKDRCKLKTVHIIKKSTG